MTTSAPPSATGKIATTKRFTILAAAAGLSTWAIDTAATQVGLPSMQSSLGLSVTDSQWILNITLMILAGLVTVGGALGDRAGRMRMFRLGLILIIGASLVTFGGGLVNQFLIVMGGRALAGVGAALMLPAATAVLLDVFPREERGYAQGRMMMISMTATAFAPTVIGLIIQGVSWPFAYLATGAAGALTIVLSRKVLYEQTLQKRAPFDYLGDVLVFVTVALITIGVMQSGTDGLTSPSVLLLVGAGLVTGAILIAVSLRKAAPLIQFRLFQIRDVSIAIFMSFMRFLPNVLMGAFVARYAQEVLGLSPTVTGLLMILPILAQASTSGSWTQSIVWRSGGNPLLRGRCPCVATRPIHDGAAVSCVTLKLSWREALYSERSDRDNLAGRKSTLVGTDKLFVPLLGKPMIEHVLERVSDFGQRETILVTNKPELYSPLVFMPSEELGCERSFARGHFSQSMAHCFTLMSSVLWSAALACHY